MTRGRLIAALTFAAMLALPATARIVLVDQPITLADSECRALPAGSAGDAKSGLAFQCQHALADTTYETNGALGPKKAHFDGMMVSPVGEGWRACGIRYLGETPGIDAHISVRVDENQNYHIQSSAGRAGAHLYRHVIMRWVRPASPTTPLEAANRFDCSIGFLLPANFEQASGHGIQSAPRCHWAYNGPDHPKSYMCSPS
jgi:hypothetical protein